MGGDSIRDHAGAFACQTEDGLGHALLGYHDGIDVWTVDISADPGGRQQYFVSRHESAHHRLHSATPWGLAALACGVPDRNGYVARDSWVAIVDACRRCHEIYATYAAWRAVPDADEILRGNFRYLSYLRDGLFMADSLGRLSEEGDVAVELLLRMAMAPQALALLDLKGLQSSVMQLPLEARPDFRLDRILVAIEDDEGFVTTLRDALRVENDESLDLGLIRAELTRIGAPTLEPHEESEWTESIVAELDEVHPGRYVIESKFGTDRLSELFDDQQRERVQLHPHPLPLRTVMPDANGRFDVKEFARIASGIGKHVWLTWLHSGVLIRQFEPAEVPADKCMLGLLSCDRTHGEPHASWFPFPDVPPGIAARSFVGSDVEPLLFTTLRSIEAAAESDDFRGFEPAFVLLDSDVLGFLRRSEEGGSMVWSVIGSTGDRTVDILLLEQVAIPQVVYMYVCTAPTGHMCARWMRSRSEAFVHDPRHFEQFAAHAWALVEHVLGAFFLIDLHGWRDVAWAQEP